MSFLTVRFDGNGVPEVLRVAKREVKKRLKEGMVNAAEEHVLPRILSTAPHIVRGALTIKAGTRGPKVTSKGPRKFDRIAGLLNFGGNSISTIAPIKTDGHQALDLGGGIIRARVATPRHYTGSHFIERGIDLGFPDFSENVLEAVMLAFDGIPHTP